MYSSNVKSCMTMLNSKSTFTDGDLARAILEVTNSYFHIELMLDSNDIHQGKLLGSVGHLSKYAKRVEQDSSRSVFDVIREMANSLDVVESDFRNISLQIDSRILQDKPLLD